MAFVCFYFRGMTRYVIVRADISERAVNYNEEACHKAQELLASS